MTLTLAGASGKPISTQQGRLNADSLLLNPIYLPRPGHYRLQATSGSRTQTVNLEASPAPGSSYGGVTALGGLGLASGAADYLRAHGFAVTEVGAGQDFGAIDLFVVGDARLGLAPAELATTYAQLWRRIGAGGQVLLLDPPPPGVSAYWPLQAPLQPAAPGCSEDLLDPPMGRGLSSSGAAADLLQPVVAYDLDAQSAINLYHWNGYRLPKASTQPSAGYSGCHPLFSYRYGSGWVTVSTVPLLERFQDVRARIYLMNLIQAVLERKHAVPPSPGLEWVMQQRLKKMPAGPAASPAAWLETAAAAYYEPAPAPLAPVPVLVPALTDGDPASCWTPPAAAGAPSRPERVRLSFDRELVVHQLELNFGADRSHWPSALRVEGSSDAEHWQAIAPALRPSAIDAQGIATVAVTGAGAAWRDFRLTASSTSQSWRMCEFAAR